jgi:hypothetical protein
LLLLVVVVAAAAAVVLLRPLSNGSFFVSVKQANASIANSFGGESIGSNAKAPHCDEGGGGMYISDSPPSCCSTFSSSSSSSSSSSCGSSCFNTASGTAMMTQCVA